MSSLKLEDLKNPMGWCLPTILVVVFATIIFIALVARMVKAVPEDKERSKLHILSQLILTLLVASLMFYLCYIGKKDIAWIVFGVLYILPIVLTVIISIFKVEEKN
jgi:small-conductance mechanosensitive channel